MEPDILALDEPSSNLDARGRRELLTILSALPVTKIVIAQDLLFVLELCERAVIIDNGKVVADEPIEKLMADEELLEAHGLEAPLGFAELREKAKERSKVRRLKRTEA